IRYQSACFDRLPEGVHGRQSSVERKGIDAVAVDDHQRVDHDVDCVRAIPERLERRCDILTSPDFECSHLISEGSGCRLSVAHFQYHGVISNICRDCQSAKAGYDLAQNFDPLSSKENDGVLFCDHHGDATHTMFSFQSLTFASMRAKKKGSRPRALLSHCKSKGPL